MDSGLAVSVIELNRTTITVVENMKIGIDIHGVIDKTPHIFARLTKVLRDGGHEVIIITGVEITPELLDTLDTFGVTYGRVFSITSYHKSIGTHITYKNGDKTQPLIAPPVWDRTKAEFCQREGVDIHIDDSPEYGKHFEGIDTQFILYNEAMAGFLWELLWGAAKNSD